jgi:hypothetical protein
MYYVSVFAKEELDLNSKALVLNLQTSNRMWPDMHGVYPWDTNVTLGKI